MSRILIACTPQWTPFMEPLVAGIERVPSATYAITSSVHATLQQARSTAYDLFIVEVSLAPQAGMAPDPKGGIALCEMLRRGGIAAPVHLLVPRFSREIQERLNGMPSPPHQLETSPGWHHKIASTLEALPEPARRLDVIISAKAEGWKWELRSTGFPFRARSGNLKVTKPLRDSWKEKNGPCSHAAFEEIGRSITACLCQEEENDVFAERLMLGIQEAGGIHNTRVSFVVDGEHYPLLLEAIFDPQEDHWLVKAPLLRHLLTFTPPAENIFTSRSSRLRALLVCADTCGAVAEGTGVSFLDPLDSIAGECRALARMLQRENDRRGGMAFDTIKLVGGAGDPPLTAKRLVETIQGGQWDLVHFAGHAHYQNERDAFLFAGPRGRPEPVPFSKIAASLDSAQLLYLSSCTSTGAAFANEAAKRKIRTVVGFRSRVEDHDAALHARLFYRDLLRHGAVDRAFWTARRRLHGRYKESNAWWSSMLVMGQQ